MKLSRDEFRDLTRSFLTEAEESSNNLRFINEVTPGERRDALRHAEEDSADSMGGSLDAPLMGDAWGDVGGSPRDARGWADFLGQLIDQDLTSRGVWYEEEGSAVVEALEKLRREITDEMRGPTR